MKPEPWPRITGPSPRGMPRPRGPPRKKSRSWGGSCCRPGISMSSPSPDTRRVPSTLTLTTAGPWRYTRSEKPLSGRVVALGLAAGAATPATRAAGVACAEVIGSLAALMPPPRTPAAIIAPTRVRVFMGLASGKWGPGHRRKCSGRGDEDQCGDEDLSGAQGERHPRKQPLAAGALHELDPAAVALCDAAHDREAEPGAAFGHALA